MTKQNQKNAQKQGQPQKRKAEGQAQPQQAKKAKEQQPQQQQKKSPQQQQQKQQPKQPQQQQKKAPAKKAEPEPEEEEDEDDEEGAGERNEEALAAIAAVEPKMDAIAAELAAFDEQMNAEIYAIQKKFLLKKRPVLKKRDELLSGVTGLWKTLLSEHLVFASQMEEADHAILDNLINVEEEQVYSDAAAEKQQIIGITVFFTFSAGSKSVKAGRYKKTFTFDEEKESLVCVPTPAKDLPFVAADFTKKNTDSFFALWFASEGVDEGILAAQDALSSELYVDPLQLYAHLAEGNPMPSMDDNSDSDDGEGDAMMFEDDEDDEAPELVDDEE